MRLNNSWLVSLLLVLAFLVRLFPVTIPAFTPDEARIAFRGYTLSTRGTDELDRKFPFLFNSSEDYQLPSVSYLTALGILIFGKSDLGARIPFILIGTFLILLIYEFSKIIFRREDLSFFAPTVATFSPGLIFFSKFPNEFIVSVFLMLLLLISLLKERINKLIVSAVILSLLLTGKIFLFTLLPFISLSLYMNKKRSRADMIYVISFSIVTNLLLLYVFLHIPQGIRSLIENNFSIVNDISIKNGIERLRSQNLGGWSLFLDRILFNKFSFLTAGFFHWISHFQPSILFAQLDNSGKYGFLNMGAFPKITIVPFLIGIITLIQGQLKNYKYLALYIIVLTFPLFFLYSSLKVEYIVMVLPFLALIIALGFINMHLRFIFLIFSIIIFEYLINIFFIPATIKNSNDQRPFWINPIISEGYILSLNDNVAFSDDITADLVPFIQWNMPVNINERFLNLEFPYKFRQSQISNIKIVGSNNTFYNCSKDKPTFIFTSKKYLQKVQKDIRVLPIKTYRDGLGKEVIFLLPKTICVH